MTGGKLSVAQANLKMTLWNAEAESTTSSDFYTWLQSSGLPEEVGIRLHELITQTKKIGSKVISIGKVLLFKIIEFVKAHPFLVAGAGICAVVGSAIYTMIVSIPWVGVLLEPIARALGIGLTVAGAIVGHSLDKSFPGVSQNLAEVTEEFFRLVADVMNTIAGNAIPA